MTRNIYAVVCCKHICEDDCHNPLARLRKQDSIFAGRSSRAYARAPKSLELLRILTCTIVVHGNMNNGSRGFQYMLHIRAKSGVCAVRSTTNKLYVCTLGMKDRRSACDHFGLSSLYVRRPLMRALFSSVAALSENGARSNIP